MTRFYGTAEWKALRAACLRAHPICATSGCGARSVVADHVIPRRQGGTDSLDNLVGRCLACHNARRGTAEPRLKGCGADGTPRDRAHWWNAGNLSGPGAATVWGEPKPVSSPPGRRGRR
ncbi:HNH endonuclease [Roseomonas sp. JC162]|uniref:HNH endonuclease n=1 Tax=Neoroseomonas marina TaxID=1232220 RepID=A0A848ECI7_9PROT|nr:HNH endonuclease [Neoroseomonas marina]